MTVDELLEQAKALTQAERHELAARLQAMQAEPEHESKTGAEIVAMLEAIDEQIGLVDAHIEYRVEWVKAQRRKRRETRNRH